VWTLPNVSAHFKRRKNQAVAAQYQVRGVPTMILFQNGKQLWRQSGVISKEEIIKIIVEKSNS
jgi:thioredoxin 1